MARRKKNKQAINRRPFWERLLEWILGWVKKLIVPALIIWLIGWLWLGGVFVKTANIAWNGFVEWTADQGFQVQNIIINGRIRTDINILKDVINVEPNDPILAVNIQSIQDKIENFVWVDSVSVKRNYNGIIIVDLVEKIPFFIWDRPGRKQSLMDTNGRIINDVNVDNFSGLLIVSGIGAPNHAPYLMKMLMSEPDVANRIKFAQWVGGRRWTLSTSNKMVILLPENDIGYALSRLAKLGQEKNIFNQDLLSIDLRLSDRIIIESQDGKASAFDTQTSMDNI
jgi:cell division protein FtsQ